MMGCAQVAPREPLPACVASEEPGSEDAWGLHEQDAPCHVAGCPAASPLAAKDPRGVKKTGGNQALGILILFGVVIFTAVIIADLITLPWTAPRHQAFYCCRHVVRHCCH
jgi:hypothetical protein